MCQKQLIHFKQESRMDRKKLQFPQQDICLIPQAHKEVRQITVEVIVNVSPLRAGTHPQSDCSTSAKRLYEVSYV